VFEFININPKDFAWLQEEESMSFANYKAKSVKTEVMIEENKPTSYYEILITEMSNAPISLMLHTKTIRKTFKEFESLHKALDVRFKTKSLKLPDLPAKYNAFSNKTSAQFRSQGLERYLNELFKISCIGDSFALRRFIGYMSTSKPGSQTEISATTPMMYAHSQPILSQRAQSPMSDSSVGKGKEPSSSPNSFANILMKKKYKD